MTEPTVKLSLGTNVPIADNGQLVTIPWDKELYDSFDMHDQGQPERIVAPTDGLYRVTADIQFSTDGAGSRYVVIHVIDDPSERIAESVVRAVPAPPNTVVNLSGEVSLQAGQWVSVSADVFGAGNVVPVIGAESEDLTFVTMTRVSS